MIGFGSRSIGNAMSAVTAAKSLFAQRGIDANQLPAAQGGLLPLDGKSEAERAARVESNFGAVASREQNHFNTQSGEKHESY